MDLDHLLLSRLQFAFTIIWHIIFPAFTIGLSAYIATLCVVWLATDKERYRELARFVMLPIIFGYTIFVYWIFGGKLREGEGYH